MDIEMPPIDISCIPLACDAAAEPMCAIAGVLELAPGVLELVLWV
jgi:hypothetical protein